LSRWKAFMVSRVNTIDAMYLCHVLERVEWCLQSGQRWVRIWALILLVYAVDGMVFCKTDACADVERGRVRGLSAG
jgi:hypothetical protein